MIQRPGAPADRYTRSDAVSVSRRASGIGSHFLIWVLTDRELSDGSRIPESFPPSPEEFANHWALLTNYRRVYMKQSTLLVAAATSLLLSGSAIAQTMGGHGRGMSIEPAAYASSAAVTYRVVDSLANAYSFYSTNAEPVKYDPLVNVLSMIKRGTPEQSGNLLFIRSSTDLGMTWGPALGPLHDAAAAGSGPARYPSLVVNPTHSTNAQEFFYYYTSPVLINGGFGGMVSGLIGQAGTEVIPAATSGGIGEAIYGSDSRSVASADGSTVVSIHALSDQSFIIRRLDLNSGTTTETVPAQFAADTYLHTETAGSRYTTSGGIDIDPNGAIHIMVWGRLADTAGQLAMPLPILYKSTDNGATWTSGMPMPNQVLRDYAAGAGFTDGQWTTTYGPTGFVATGADRAAMIFGLYNTDTTAENPVNQIVEVRYNNGTWNVFKVADISGSWFTFDGVSQVENEIQLSRTANYETIVAKWVDLVEYNYTEDIDGNGEGNDTLLTTDVFVASRTTNQGTWSLSKNATETPMLDRLAWMPVGIIPSDLSRLPIISVQAAPSAENVTITDQMVTGQLDLLSVQHVVATNVDARGVAGSAPVTGELNASAVRSIAPNPTSGAAVVTVNVAKSGTGSVEIWNSLGQRVASLDNGTLQAGERSYNLSGDLSAGAYRVVLTVDGQTVTQPFNVVR